MSGQVFMRGNKLHSCRVMLEECWWVFVRLRSSKILSFLASPFRLWIIAFYSFNSSLWEWKHRKSQKTFGFAKPGKCAMTRIRIPRNYGYEGVCLAQQVLTFLLYDSWAFLPSLRSSWVQTITHMAARLGCLSFCPSLSLGFFIVLFSCQQDPRIWWAMSLKG